MQSLQKSFGNFIKSYTQSYHQFSSVSQSCLTFCNPMDCSTPDFPVHHPLPEFTQTHVHQSVMPSNHLILCHPLLLPSMFSSIRVFSNESILLLRWPKYWSFSFSMTHPSWVALHGMSHSFIEVEWLCLLMTRFVLLMVL